MIDITTLSIGNFIEYRPGSSSTRARYVGRIADMNPRMITVQWAQVGGSVFQRDNVYDIKTESSHLAMLNRDSVLLSDRDLVELVLQGQQLP